MTKVTVYQFDKYDIRQDRMVRAPRWGTREAIEARDCRVLEGTAVEVEESTTETDEPGLTALGFDPHASEFQPGPNGMISIRFDATLKFLVRDAEMEWSRELPRKEGQAGGPITIWVEGPPIGNTLNYIVAPGFAAFLRRKGIPFEREETHR